MGLYPVRILELFKPPFGATESGLNEHTECFMPFTDQTLNSSTNLSAKIKRVPRMLKGTETVRDS